MNQNDFPANVEIEQQILSAMLVRDGEKIPAILNILSADDFYFVKNKIIFNSLVSFYLKGFKFDMLSIADEMKKSGSFEKVGADYLIECFGATYTNAYIEQHAKIIKEKSEMRRLMLIPQKMTTAIQEGKKSVADIINDVSEEFSGFTADDVTTKFITAKDYFTNDFESEIAQAKRYALRKTGFSNIDENQIFCPGVYFIGAVPACGKTTFAWQLLEQLSKKGDTCVYCSYEMSCLELFTKSIARELFKRNPSTTLTAAEIRRGGESAEVKKIITEKKKDDSDLRILELHDETIDDLLTILRPLCTGKRKAPIVAIDYLQIIPNAKDNSKLGIDDTVRKLKDFQRITNTTFIVISSFNRTNYTQTVSFESFKESGGIEFTADCVWGLQLNVMNEIKSGMGISEMRKKIDEAKKQKPRQIQMKCLKNRQGTNYDCYFKYFPAHDIFIPCEESEFTTPDGDDF